MAVLIRAIGFIFAACHVYYTTAPLCDTERLGWTHFKPAKSCQNILSAGDSRGTGMYWIHPGNPGNPFQVYCDMEAEQGGWLLVTNVVIPSTAEPPPVGFKNMRISATSLGRLRQLTGFTQIRFQCYQAKVGRKIHIITAKSPAGYAVVDYFSAKTKVRPAACLSFYRGTGDNSMLATRCADWGFSGKWGSDIKNDKMRLNDHPFCVKKKYHWILTSKTFRCDEASSAGLSANDYWKVYVR